MLSLHYDAREGVCTSKQFVGSFDVSSLQLVAYEGGGDAVAVDVDGVCAQHFHAHFEGVLLVLCEGLAALELAEAVVVAEE